MCNLSGNTRGRSKLKRKLWPVNDPLSCVVGFRGTACCYSNCATLKLTSTATHCNVHKSTVQFNFRHMQVYGRDIVHLWVGAVRAENRKQVHLMVTLPLHTSDSEILFPKHTPLFLPNSLSQTCTHAHKRTHAQHEGPLCSHIMLGG